MEITREELEIFSREVEEAREQAQGRRITIELPNHISSISGHNYISGGIGRASPVPSASPIPSVSSIDLELVYGNRQYTIHHNYLLSNKDDRPYRITEPLTKQAMLDRIELMIEHISMQISVVGIATRLFGYDTKKDAEDIREKSEDDFLSVQHEFHEIQRPFWEAEIGKLDPGVNLPVLVIDEDLATALGKVLEKLQDWVDANSKFWDKVTTLNEKPEEKPGFVQHVDRGLRGVIDWA